MTKDQIKRAFYVILRNLYFIPKARKEFTHTCTCTQSADREHLHYTHGSVCSGLRVFISSLHTSCVGWMPATVIHHYSRTITKTPEGCLTAPSPSSQRTLDVLRSCLCIQMPRVPHGSQFTPSAAPLELSPVSEASTGCTGSREAPT